MLTRRRQVLGRGITALMAEVAAAARMAAAEGRRRSGRTPSKRSLGLRRDLLGRAWRSTPRRAL